MSWNSYVLGDILKRRKSIEKIDFDKEYKLVTIKLYHKGVLLRKVTKGSELKSTMFSVKFGDFVLSGIDARNGAFGIVPLELDGAIITNDFWCLEPDENIISKEFFLYLSSTDFFDHICKQSSDGTTQRIRLQKERFFNYKIDLPSIDEQKIILSKLNLQEKIKEELNIELSNQLSFVKKLRQQLLQDAMKGKLVKQILKEGNSTELLKKIKTEKEELIKNKKTKDTFSIHKKAIKNPPFNLPENWQWVRFWDIAWCFRGHNPPKTLFKKEPQKGYVRFVQITDFKTESQAVYVPISKQLKLVSRGEIIMAAYRHIGKLSRNMEGAFNVALCKINNIEPFDRDFLELVIKSDLITGELLKASERGHIPSMHSKHLLSLWVPVPPLSEQHRIVKKYTQFMRFCDELQHNIQKSKIENEKLLQGILRDALRKPKKLIIRDNKVSFAKQVLGGKIVSLFRNDNNFTHIKFQKLQYLAEQIIQADLNWNYYRQTAGPYDNKFMHSVAYKLKANKWFEEENYKFKPLTKANEIDNYYKNYFGVVDSKLDTLFNLLKKATEAHCEVIATTYAVWNNMIIKNEGITDDKIIKYFFEWSTRKEKYSEKQVLNTIAWIKDKGFEPTGFGYLIKEKKKNNGQ